MCVMCAINACEIARSQSIWNCCCKHITFSRGNGPETVNVQFSQLRNLQSAGSTTALCVTKCVSEHIKWCQSNSSVSLRVCVCVWLFWNLSIKKIIQWSAPTFKPATVQMTKVAFRPNMAGEVEPALLLADTECSSSELHHLTSRNGCRHVN